MRCGSTPTVTVNAALQRERGERHHKEAVLLRITRLRGLWRQLSFLLDAGGTAQISEEALKSS